MTYKNKNTYIAYLDEFGCVGPFVSATDPKYKASPVFGLAGYVLPINAVRDFGTWFFQGKCTLLADEIERLGAHPAQWEKKGRRLYNDRNIKKYRWLKLFTHHFFDKIDTMDGFVFYVGYEKTTVPNEHNAVGMYLHTLREVVKRLDQFCRIDCKGDANFIIALDEHKMKSLLTKRTAFQMYNKANPHRHLIEPPFHLESHLHQTIQAADWISAIVNRLGTFKARPNEYPELAPYQTHFQLHLKKVSKRSSASLI